MKTAPQPQTDTRFVYSFDEAIHGGRELLGGKGVGLAEMAHLDVPVPAGFTITTDACRAYMTAGGDLHRGSRSRSRSTSAVSSTRPARTSAIRSTRCSSPFGPVRRSRCPG